MKDHLYNLLENFVINNNFKINPEDFKLQLVSNPTYPSVKAISDSLDYFGIENIVANVPKDALGQLPNYFLAVLKTESSSTIALVQQFKNNKIKLFKDDGKKERITASDFKNLWNGTIIAIEKSKEKISKPFISLRNPLVPLSVTLVIILGYSMLSLNYQAVIYTLLACLGCCIGYFIVLENLGLRNKVTSKICNSEANNTSCSDVINSNKKLFGLFSLSDATITFFVASVLTISLFGYNPSFFLGLSIVSIPIIAYSLYSQAFVIKKWCPLCLGIVGVLVAQLITTILFTKTIGFDFSYLIKSIALVLSLYLIWQYLKTVIIKALQLEQTQTEFLKFKRNDVLFETLLHKETLPSSEKIPSEFSISFGNLNAPLVITSVTNPLCGFCTKAFEDYDSLLKKHGDKIKLTIIFNVPSDNLEQVSSQISQQIIELYQENPIEAYKALKQWFTNRDVDSWQKYYGIPTNDTPLHTLELHKTWCNLNKISYTPATIVDNQFFPKEYQIKDLSLFIDYLIENKKEIKKEPSIH